MIDLNDLGASIAVDLDEALQVHRDLKSKNVIRVIAECSQLAAERVSAGGFVFFAGNGGSFADAQHMAAEFSGRMARERRPLPGIALGTNSSSITAVGNDYGFDDVFVRELMAFGSSRDFLVAFSTSGQSPNIRALLKQAQDMGMESVLFTGMKETDVSAAVRCIQVPSVRTERIQECHTLLGHIFCHQVENLLHEQGFISLGS